MPLNFEMKISLFLRLSIYIKNQKMKQILSVLLFLCLANAWGENRVVSEVKEATLYLSGAKLQNTANISLVSGTNDLVFENLTPFINAQSLQVKIKGNARLMSVKFRTHYPEQPKLDPRVRTYQDSIIYFMDEQQLLTDERNILAQEESFMMLFSNKMGNTTTNSDGSVTTGMTSKEVTDFTTLYRNRLLEIRKRFLEITKIERKYAEGTQRLREKIANLSPSNTKTSGEIVMQVNSPVAQTVEITCIYLTTAASWKPIYDISSEGTDKPVKLTYKAEIRQTTGLDWKNIKLHVSTANPFSNNSRPLLYPLYANFQIMHAYRDYDGDGRYDADEKVQEESEKMAAPAAVSNMMQISTYDLSRAADPSKIMNQPIDKIEAISETNNDTKVELDVPLTHTISANGEEHLVEVSENEIPATYEYHAVPKLDQHVFLLAKITNYGQYNIMPANANIFYQNTFIGQSFIDTKTVSDTLLLSFGKDENITVKRNKPQEVSNVPKIIGNNKKEVVTYEIVVKNNKPSAINIEILDQIPVSRTTDIEIELTDAGVASYVKDYGKLQWKISIPANTAKKLYFSYSLKYPKDKVLQYTNDGNAYN